MKPVWIGIACFLAVAAALAAGTASAAFEIDFMRHGETLWNRAKVLQGSVSYSRLSAKGVAVAVMGEGLALTIQSNDTVATDL